MDYVNLGSSGLRVSQICLGCMTFGDPDRGAHEWTLTEDDSRPIIQHAIDSGINFFDTANSYSAGSSEEIVGRALKSFVNRDDVVIATKVFHNGRRSPYEVGLSRKAIMTEVEGSLRRLGTDYIDLYQTHRWDHRTPIEETMEALHDLVKAGKVRYIGASSMYAWQFSKAQYTAEANGWTKFISMQDHYNLLYREEEREMHPLCADQGVGVIPWSPLARGRLTRDWDTSTKRSDTDKFGATLYDDDDRRTVEAVTDIAESHGVPRAQIALSWVLNKPIVTAPIIGASKVGHIDDAVAATEVTLTDDEVAILEGNYRPRPIVGFA